MAGPGEYARPNALNQNICSKVEDIGPTALAGSGKCREQEVGGGGRVGTSAARSTAGQIGVHEFWKILIGGTMVGKP